MMVTKTENKTANSINHLLNQIPNNLLDKRDELEFKIEFTNDTDAKDPHIVIVLKTPGVDLAYFDATSMGFLADTCSQLPEHYYCNKAFYKKSATASFNNQKVCPYTAICDKVKEFIEKYADKHKLPQML